MKKKNHPPIFLINKINRPERLINTINELSKVGLTDYIIRKEACSIERAKELKYEYINQDIYDNIEKNLVSCNLLPTWGSVGCAISHIEIWKMMVEENIKYSIIMEDDNIIYDKDKFLWNYNDALKKIKKSEYLSLFISLCSDTKDEYKNFIDRNIYIPLTYFIGTSFYFISLCAAKDLLKKIKTVYMQIDLEIGNVFLHNNNLEKLKLTIYENSGIKQDYKFISDVQHYFITVGELYELFKIPYEIAEKIHFFLPSKKYFENDFAYNLLR